MIKNNKYTGWVITNSLMVFPLLVALVYEAKIAEYIGVFMASVASVLALFIIFGIKLVLWRLDEDEVRAIFAQCGKIKFAVPVWVDGVLDFAIVAMLYSLGYIVVAIAYSLHIYATIRVRELTVQFGVTSQK